MKIPNFDDVDLGIAGITIIAITGLIIGFLILLLLNEKIDLPLFATPLFPSARSCIPCIAAFVSCLK